MTEENPSQDKWKQFVINFTKVDLWLLPSLIVIFALSHWLKFFESVSTPILLGYIVVSFIIRTEARRYWAIEEEAAAEKEEDERLDELLALHEEILELKAENAALKAELAAKNKGS